MIHDYIIIGGGASGLMLAARLKVNNGIILEGSSRVGTKLLMAGGGRCNITHEGSIKDFLTCYGANGSKVRTCLYKHSNLDMMQWFGENGLPVSAENGRVFPVSRKSQDVLDLLLRLSTDNCWETITDSRVSGISYVDYEGGYYSVKADSCKYAARKLVIATGGITYPNTGSDGSMFAVLESLGIEIEKPTSVLAPLGLKDYPYAELAGVSIQNVRITCGKGKKASVSEGDLLFAHKEISGPAVLNISRDAAPGKSISINYIPDVETPFEDLVAAVGRSKADVSTVVADVFKLPKRFCQIVCQRASSSKSAARDGVSLKRVAEILRRDSFEVQTRGSNGMVTAGGVKLSEISTKTMELKKHPGLYVIGEALDVDRITGGYNLQFAYSSAAAVADALNE